MSWEQAPEKPKSTAARITKLNLPTDMFASETEEKVGLLNKAAPHGLNLNLDPDIVEALDDNFDYEDPDNILEDNFMELAQNSDISEDGYSEDDEGSDVSSNFSSEERDEVGSLNCSEGDDKFDDLETKTRFTEYSLSSSVIRRNEQLRLLDQRFEKMYLDTYDDQDIGALDTDDIENEVADTANEMLMRYINEYQEAKKSKTLEKNEDGEFIDSTLKLTDKQDDESTDDEMVYIDVTPKIEYDCQSILTLNSENKYKHKPSMIPNLPSMKKPKNKIQIHPVTGIPINTLGNNKSQLTIRSLAQFDAENNANDLKAAGGKSIAAESCISRLTALSMRSKNESKEEKHERKQALKDYRRERRLEKKANMLAFKDEKKRQEKIMLNLKQNIQGFK